MTKANSAGAKITLPSGYHGCLLERSKVQDTAQNEEWMHKASFNGFQYWNHDAVPTKTDPMRKCADWLELSKHVRLTCSPLALSASS